MASVGEATITVKVQMEKKLCEVICLNSDCANNLYDSCGCNLKQVEIGKDGKCSRYRSIRGNRDGTGDPLPDEVIVTCTSGKPGEPNGTVTHKETESTPTGEISLAAYFTRKGCFKE